MGLDKKVNPIVPRWWAREGRPLVTTRCTPPCVTFRLVVAPLQGPGQSPVLPVACCVGLLLSAAAAGALAGVVSAFAFAEPSIWCVGMLGCVLSLFAGYWLASDCPYYCHYLGLGRSIGRG